MSCAEKHRSYGADVCQAEREDYIECLHHSKLVSSNTYQYQARSLTLVGESRRDGLARGVVLRDTPIVVSGSELL